MLIPEYRSELKGIFDDQFDKICELIDSQLRIVRESHSGEIIVRADLSPIVMQYTLTLQSYLVLSGGLGSSPYIQDRIKAKYERGMGHIQVLVAAEPYVCF